MKCYYCEKSRNKENGSYMKIQHHWSFPKRTVWMCNECIEEVKK